MELEGIHHITAITGDAPGNVDFYTRVLGLRLVAKTVNQDQPDVYHLFFASETGKPGSELTFFEYPGAIPGQPGEGMVHRIVSRVVSPEALDFWAQRLGDLDVPAERTEGSVRFADPEGLAHELVVSTVDEPLVAQHPDIPEAYALGGFASVRAYSGRPERSAALLERVLGATPGCRPRGSSTVTTSTRSTSASPAGCCSRSPTTGPASPSTGRWRSWGRRSSCRRSSSRGGRRSRRA